MHNLPQIGLRKITRDGVNYYLAVCGCGWADEFAYGREGYDQQASNFAAVRAIFHDLTQHRRGLAPLDDLERVDAYIERLEKAITEDGISPLPDSGATKLSPRDSAERGGDDA